MAQTFMSYQINGFWGKRGMDKDIVVWVSPSSLTCRESPEVKVTVQITCTFWVCGDCGTDLDPSITVRFRAVIPAQQQQPTCRAVVAGEPFSAPHQFTGTRTRICPLHSQSWQTPWGLRKCRHLLSSSPDCPTTPRPPSPCFFLTSFLWPYLSLGDPRAATSATIIAILQPWLIPAEKPTWVWADSTRSPVGSLQSPWPLWVPSSMLC